MWGKGYRLILSKGRAIKHCSLYWFLSDNSTKFITGNRAIQLLPMIGETAF
jgi:hypothetical protein